MQPRRPQRIGCRFRRKSEEESPTSKPSRHEMDGARQFGKSPLRVFLHAHRMAADFEARPCARLRVVRTTRLARGQQKSRSGGRSKCRTSMGVYGSEFDTRARACASGEEAGLRGPVAELGQTGARPGPCTSVFRRRPERHKVSPKVQVFERQPLAESSSDLFIADVGPAFRCLSKAPWRAGTPGDAQPARAVGLGVAVARCSSASRRCGTSRPRWPKRR